MPLRMADETTNLHDHVTSIVVHFNPIVILQASRLRILGVHFDDRIGFELPQPRGRKPLGMHSETRTFGIEDDRVFPRKFVFPTTPL